MAESHQCDYDYKKEREKLVKKLPKIDLKRGNTDFEDFNN